MKSFRFILFPLSLLYVLIIRIRNLAFDLHLLPSESFNLPIISVGNLKAGGSGKTPMVEYLIRLLGESNGLAILSRGYKRKSKGYRLAGERETIETLGDEPLQYHLKFPEIRVAVCEKRRAGIRHLLHDSEGIKTILLDDAFQHRYVKPGISILVTEYYQTYAKDWLLPYGRLREPISGSRRADIIVVTKTPKIFSPIIRRQLIEELNPLPTQTVCFSYIQYQAYKPVYVNSNAIHVNAENLYSIVLLTGIANPGPIEEYTRRKCSDLELFHFDDHHAFTRKELNLVKEKFLNLPTQRKIIITTEKDAMRLQNPMAESILSDLPIFYIHISFEFHKPDKPVFDEAVKKWVHSFQKR